MEPDFIPDTFWSGEEPETGGPTVVTAWEIPEPDSPSLHLDDDLAPVDVTEFSADFAVDWAVAD